MLKLKYSFLVGICNNHQSTTYLNLIEIWLAIFELFLIIMCIYDFCLWLLFRPPTLYGPCKLMSVFFSFERKYNNVRYLLKIRTRTRFIQFKMITILIKKKGFSLVYEYNNFVNFYNSIICNEVYYSPF